MRTEQFDITIAHKGIIKSVPVFIENIGHETRITALIDGTAVLYQQDAYHDSLQPAAGLPISDIELLYLVGKEICRQHREAQL
ncbi:hypothetical protein [Chitinophaga vietnamensis]|uniref:hypothetical protein n=1 Tax=Chitinophaga vietnamensis TaxID=2593957 RepID=UPI0011788231|nr:hypothetical protein [Chitinophaga vietnamensis]